MSSKKLNNLKGINFQCQGSANCCISRGSYGYVYLSKKDILLLSQFKKLKLILLLIDTAIKLMALFI